MYIILIIIIVAVVANIAFWLLPYALVAGLLYWLYKKIFSRRDKDNNDSGNVYRDSNMGSKSTNENQESASKNAIDVDYEEVDD